MEKYMNGSDMLVSIAGKAFGHCTSHTISISAETKDRQVKPLATVASGLAKFKEKSANLISITVSGSGLMAMTETEAGMKELREAMFKGEPVDVKAFERGKDASAWLEGSFVITSLEEEAPAGEDVTYSIQLDNNGEPTKYPGKVGSES